MVSPSNNSHNFPLKFLCSYGGKIMPRQTDGKLRYYGGETRVLSVDRSISFTELLLKLGEMSGSSVSLRCQLPNEDLDALISITSDEDLVNLIEEYDRVSAISSFLKIRAFLYPPKSTKKVVSPTPSIASTSSTNSTTISNPDATSSPSSFCSTVTSPSASTRHHDCPRPYKKVTRNSLDETINGRIRHIRTRSSPVMFPICPEQVTAKTPQYAYHHSHGNNSSHIYLIHHGNHWQ
uniref:Putative ovule protein n=1 Tax=Solanum chacoense TaxID=4108 RepID=A0A0V0H9P9_SOLCH